MTAEERVRARLKADGSVDTTRRNPCSNSLRDDLEELLADYRRMSELAGESLQAAQALREHIKKTTSWWTCPDPRIG